MWFAACPIHFAPYLARTALVSLCTRPLNSLLSSTSFSSCKARNPPPPRAACCWPSLPPGQQRAPPPPPTPITPRTTCDLCTPHIQVPILHPIPPRTPPPCTPHPSLGILPLSQLTPPALFSSPLTPLTRSLHPTHRPSQPLPQLARCSPALSHTGCPAGAPWDALRATPRSHPQHPLPPPPPPALVCAC